MCGTEIHGAQLVDRADSPETFWKKQLEIRKFLKIHSEVHTEIHSEAQRVYGIDTMAVAETSLKY